MFLENFHHCEVLCSSSFLKELFELIKLILWRLNNQTYHLDCWGILRFSWCGVSILRSLGFHLVRWRVKAQPILSTRSWGSKPSLLLGFITIVGGVHININIKTTSFDKPQVTNKQQKPTVILEDKSPNSLEITIKLLYISNRIVISRNHLSYISFINTIQLLMDLHRKQIILTLLF